ncbi:YafY family protein [Agromyces sp. NBRC 114283]|nr:YafY family protein [Agromyces sp. NBRC 114283]
MLESSVRMLRLLALLQSRREWAGAELADRLDVTTRTIRNDIERLRILGYRVDSSPGVAGGYRLAAGSALPPLLLDDEEAVAVAVGLRAAAAGSVTGIEEASLRALTKLEQTLPPRLRHRVDALRDATVSAAGGGPTVDASVLETIAAAARDHERLRFGYRAADGTTTDRLVEPHGLVFTGRRWYLLAWDLDREDWRSFRADRVESGAPTARRFVPREPPEGGAAAHVLRGIGSASWPVRARIRFDVSQAELLQRLEPPAGLVTPLDAQHCLVETGSNTLHDLAVYLGRLELPFAVVEPPELRDVIAGLARRFAAASTAVPAPA